MFRRVDLPEPVDIPARAERVGDTRMASTLLAADSGPGAQVRVATVEHLMSALAGLGNSAFHPADFTILNQRVSAPRLGHAFSVHGIAGNLGWAVAPLYMVGNSQDSGSWRAACVAAALWALAVLVLLAVRRDDIDDRRRSGMAGGPPGGKEAPAAE